MLQECADNLSMNKSCENWRENNDKEGNKNVILVQL